MSLVHYWQFSAIANDKWIQQSASLWVTRPLTLEMHHTRRSSVHNALFTSEAREGSMYACTIIIDSAD